MQNFTSSDVAVLVLELVPAVALGLAGERLAEAAERWLRPLRIFIPCILVLPYLWVAHSHHIFSWTWFAFYASLPPAIAGLLAWAAATDPLQHGSWQDALILLTLGLAVDLRWLESAWPAGLTGLGKLLLVDAALYGFVTLRHLQGTGFNFHFRWSDLKVGLRELAFFAPIVIALGLALGFLHPHAHPLKFSMPLTWVYIFIFIAAPEELFFRAWVQNLLERRFGRMLSPEKARKLALVIASVLFGLSHFNKRSAHFNWRYVILATIAGIFYGRAWRENRRVPASAITHASVDAIWSFWF
ncbi:MAG: CPBP family intramembrane glutamic endopeptidase [Terriglobales bacterium]